MRQLPLFGGLSTEIVRSPRITEEREENAEPLPTRDEGPWLFDPPVVLRLELDEALEDGRFDDARQRYAKLVESWNTHERLAPLRFLESIDASRLDGRLDELLRHWLAVVPWTQHLAGSTEGRRAWRGLVRRLLPVHGAAALVEACPDCVAPLVNALAEMTADPSAALEARTLLRDALLAGRALRADDFADRRIRDLLAEDVAPVWLASLGAIRRLWPVPPVQDSRLADELLAREGHALDRDTPDAARHWWDCLRIAWSPRLEDRFRHEARRRMKQIDPVLHGLAFGQR